MISRKTIFALLLTLLLGLGVYAWRLGHRDDCDRFAGGGVPATQQVQYGSQMVTVACGVWVVRQPVGVQAFCFVDAALALVFGLSLLADWKRANWILKRQQGVRKG